MNVDNFWNKGRGEMSIFNGEVSRFTTLNVMPRELFAVKIGLSVYIFLVILLVSDSVSANYQEN